MPRNSRAPERPKHAGAQPTLLELTGTLGRRWEALLKEDSVVPPAASTAWAITVALRTRHRHVGIGSILYIVGLCIESERSAIVG